MATPTFLEEYAKDFATQAKGAYSVPIDTAQFTGRQFVAGEDPLQTQAINLATSGVGAYQPFLTAAQAAVKKGCLLYTSPSPRDGLLSRMPSSA